MNYLSVIAIILTVSYSGHNLSLRCPKVSASDAIKSVDSVFVGKVIDISDPEMPAVVDSSTIIKLERPITAHIVVERVYRGEKIKDVQVATMTGTSEWGANFKVGERYLVYASKDVEREGLLRVKGCSRTCPVEEAEDDLELLRSAEVVP